MSNNIPFLNLNLTHHQFKDEFKAVFADALETGRFIGGPNVEGFENDFAEFCDTTHCVGVSSGTDALRFALIAAGVKKDDTVITVPNTFIATTESITQAGAAIAFVDIDEQTYNLSPEKLKEYLETECAFDPETQKTVNNKTGKPVTAVVPVHLYGQCADMDPILELAGKYNLIVIEDACQAHGAEYFSKKDNCWKKAGSMGIAAAFSFYPGKNLGAFGEGGAATTNDPEIDKKIRMLRDHGQAKKYLHDMEGYNGRLDAIQAGVLRIKLAHLREWNEQRLQAAHSYTRLFSEVDGVMAPVVPEGSKPVFHLYILRVQNREELQKHLSENTIGTGLHYPIPLHLQDAYTQLGYQKGDFPVTEKVSDEILSLPMFPGLTDEQIQTVVKGICDFRL